MYSEIMFNNIMLLVFCNLSSPVSYFCKSTSCIEVVISKNNRRTIGKRHKTIIFKPLIGFHHLKLTFQSNDSKVQRGLYIYSRGSFQIKLTRKV